MTLPVISQETARRYILGRQGLWPGRRWAGKDGAVQAIHCAETVQVDPLNVIARSHEIALWGRVLDYQPEHLETLLYRDREFFEYGDIFCIYPMSELPYWRVVMERKKQRARWLNFGEQHPAALKSVKSALRARGPLGNRDFEGQARVESYRARKDTGLALYYLWLTGELLIHSRRNQERIYDFRHKTAPDADKRKATAASAQRFFARKAVSLVGLCTVGEWTRTMARFGAAHDGIAEARRVLARMLERGEIAAVSVGDEKQPRYLLAEDMPLLDAVSAGRAPEAWKPLDATTEEEAIFLAPLETVSGNGRAKKLFGFDYVWEVYKPAAQRRWGYYTLPVLYGDRLVARFDSRMDRANGTLVVNGFWLEDEPIAKDAAFADALGRGFARFMRFLQAGQLDASAIQPPRLRRHIQALTRW